MPSPGDSCHPVAQATGVSRRVRCGLARIVVLMNRAWNGGLTVALWLLCFGFLAAWVPHYLTWPWSRDEDTFATLALSWEHGILPYRDIRAFNFPGHTYLFWGLGKTFGWGRTVPFYAFDASCVVLLGGVLVAWSRRRLGGALPGLVGYLVFLKSYLSFAFEGTGERDWHTALLLCLGIMIAQAWPGRLSRVVSALTAALALSIRPHAVLFLPALAAAVVEAGPNLRSAPDLEDGPNLRSTGEARFRVVLVWLSWLGLFLAMVFAPLVAAGITADWIRSLAVPAYGGPYSTVTAASAIKVFLNQFRDWKTVVPLATTALAATGSRAGLRRTAHTWLLAWLGALVYGPVHPVQHGYLIHPILLVRSITWALVAARIVSMRWPSRPVRVFALLLLVFELVPSPPWQCDLRASVKAIGALARGAMPVSAPRGCSHVYQLPSRWSEYCEVLDYLRQSTGTQTLVANVLNRHPYESINGPAGRLSPFRAEAGICWLSWNKIDLDPEFAQELENATDAVVVWESRQQSVEPRLRLERVVAVIRKSFEPVARFGDIEVCGARRPGNRQPADEWGANGATLLLAIAKRGRLLHPGRGSSPLVRGVDVEARAQARFHGGSRRGLSASQAGEVKQERLSDCFTVVFITTKRPTPTSRSLHARMVKLKPGE